MEDSPLGEMFHCTNNLIKSYNCTLLLMLWKKSIWLHECVMGNLEGVEKNSPKKWNLTRDLKMVMRKVPKCKENSTFSILDMLVSPFLNFYFYLRCLLAFFSWSLLYLATKSDPSYPCMLQQLMFIEFTLLGRYHFKQFMYMNSSNPHSDHEVGHISILHRWRIWGTVMISYLPKITQLLLLVLECPLSPS